MREKYPKLSATLYQSLSGSETLQLYTQPKFSLGTLSTLARGDGRDLSRKILTETFDVTASADSK